MPSPVWAALAFRSGEECKMTPTDGGNRTVLFADYDPDLGYALQVGQLFPALKSMLPAFAQSFGNETKPLGSNPSFSNGQVSYAGDQLTIGFSHPMDAVPTSPVYMNYGIGSSFLFGMHKERGCFSFENVGMCVPHLAHPEEGKQCQDCKKCPKCPKAQQKTGHRRL